MKPNVRFLLAEPWMPQDEVKMLCDSEGRVWPKCSWQFLPS